MFGTYRPLNLLPVTNNWSLTYQNAHELTLPMLLKLPFSGNPGRYSLDHIGREPAANKTNLPASPSEIGKIHFQYLVPKPVLFYS